MKVSAAPSMAQQGMTRRKRSIAETCLAGRLACALVLLPIEIWASQRPRGELFLSESRLTPELLANGGFEDKQLVWKGLNDEATVDRACAWAGGGCLRIEKRGGDWCSVEQQVRVRPGTLYRFQAWVKLENAWQSHYKVLWFDEAGKEISQPQNQILLGTDGTRDWFFVERPFRSPAEARRAVVCLLGGRGLDGQNPGRSWFDEVSMVELRYHPLTAAEVTGFPRIKLKGARPQTVKATRQGRWLLASNGRFELWLDASSGILRRVDYLGRPVLRNQTLELAVNDRADLRSELLSYRTQAGRLETCLRVTRPGWDLAVDRLVELSKDTVEFSYRLKSRRAPFHLDTIRAPLLPWRPFAREPRAAWLAYSIWVGGRETIGEGDEPASQALHKIGRPMQYPGGELQFPGVLFYDPESQAYLLTWCRAPKVGVYLIPDLYGMSSKFCYLANLKPGEEVATPKSCFSLGQGLPAAYARIGRLCRAPRPPKWWFHTVWLHEAGCPFHYCAALNGYRKIAEWIPQIARTGANGILLGQLMFGHQVQGGSGPTNYRPAAEFGGEADYAEMVRVARAHGMRIGAWVTISGLSDEPGSDWKSEFGVRDAEGKLYVHCPASPPLIPYHEIVGFDLAHPAVKRYLRDAIVKLVTNYGIDYIFLDSASLPVQPNFSPQASYLRYPGESMPSAIGVVDYLRREVARATKKEVAWGGEGMTWDQSLSIRFYRHGPDDRYSKFVENINRTGQRVYMGVTDSFHGLASGVARIRQADRLMASYDKSGESVFPRLLREAQQDRFYIKLSEIIKREGFDGARLLNDHVIQLRRYLLFDEGFRGQLTLKLQPHRWYLVTDLLKGGASRLKADARGNLTISYEGEGILSVGSASSETPGPASTKRTERIPRLSSRRGSGGEMAMILRSCCMVLVFAGALSTMRVQAADRGGLLLCSFERLEDLSKFQCSPGVVLERSKQYATEGEHSLKVTFQANAPQPHLHLQIHYPSYPTKDLAKYEYLEMDVYHEGNHPHVATIEFCDGKGNWRPGWVPIISFPLKHESRVQLPLFSGPAILSCKSKFSFCDVAIIRIAKARPEKDWVVYFDDLRLVPPAPPINRRRRLLPVKPARPQDLARFQSLSVFWLTEAISSEVFERYPALEVLRRNGARFKLGATSELEGLSRYDLLVLDDFPRDRLSDAALSDMKRFYELGGAVAMFGGRNSFAGTEATPGYQNSPLEEVLPVRLVRPGMYRQFPHYNHYVRLGVPQAQHPVMQGLPWPRGFWFVAADGIADPLDGYSRYIVPKDSREALAVDLSNSVPILVVGERSLAFNLEPRLRKYCFPYDFWERFIVQSFCYITRHKKSDKVVPVRLKSPAATTKTFQARPPLSLHLALPCEVLHRGERVTAEVKVSNTGRNEQLGSLEVWLEGNKRKAKLLSEESVEVRAGESRTVRCSFTVPLRVGVDEVYGIWAAYSPVSSREPVRAVAQIRVVPTSAPLAEQDVNFRFNPSRLLEKDLLPASRLFLLEEEVGLSRSNELSVELIPVFLTYGEPVGFPLSWEHYIATLHNLHRNKVPFVLASFNFWGGRSNYQTIVQGLRQQVELAREIGKEQFLGLRLSESEAIPYGYVRFQEQEEGEERVEAFSNIIKSLVREARLPRNRMLFLDVSNSIPYEWLGEAGADVIGQAFLPIVPVELSQSALRGTTRSFGKHWEWQITRWQLAETSPTVPMMFHPKTGRPTDRPQDVPSDFFSSAGFAGGAYKMYLSAYYDGAKFINAFSEDPLGGASQEAIRNAVALIRANPRGKEVVSAIAVVKGKGPWWELPRMESYGYGKPPNKDKDSDYLYLNLFFPGFSADGVSARLWWTGTPYGAVDVVYPRMGLERLKRYNCLIFLGYHRTDSVRQDFVTDLKHYVAQGGVVLLAADQMKRSNGLFDEGCSLLVGARPSLKQHNLGRIDLSEGSAFRLPRRRFDITGGSCSVHEVSLTSARVLAQDAQGIPALICNRYGRGYALLFTTPALSAFPPAGNSEFVRTVIDRVATHKPLPLSILGDTPPPLHFVISRTFGKHATIFVMNHGESAWEGSIRIHLRAAGIPSVESVRAKVGIGYEVREIVPAIEHSADYITLSGIRLAGDSPDGFCAYRDASFAVLSLTLAKGKQR